MRAVITAIAVPSARVAWAVVMFLGGATLSVQAMGTRMLATLTPGGLCSGHAAFAPHCAPCYLAAALVMASVSLLMPGVPSVRRR